ncbi:MAG: CvpA family protein [Pirellulaceae bacterium]|nr:CvpA family protein [Pirellulaceae bacterium]
MSYDVLMLLIFVGSILFGWWKGLAWQIASLAAVVVSYFVAIQFRDPLTKMLNIDQPWAPFLSMLILYGATSLGVWLAYGYVRVSIQRMQLKSFDSQIGAIIGGVKGALVCMVVTMFAVTLLGDGVRRGIVESRCGGLIARGINRLNGVVPDELHQMLDPFVNKFNDRLAQPLPPEDAETPWLGSFTPRSSSQNRPSNEAESFGQFSFGERSLEINPGVRVQINPERALQNLNSSRGSGGQFQ